ncbi:unnamed protein product [Leptosia nina]|uniref:Uncharacterized protein n=1 Tax=Leptosia nina TaxID=320188 RepID=A0AAV1JKP9_9NEOP
MSDDISLRCRADELFSVSLAPLPRTMPRVPFRACLTRTVYICYTLLVDTPLFCLAARKENVVEPNNTIPINI